MSNELAPAHAKLSASGSKKWLTCTRSSKLEEQFSDEESEFAKEGTFAHAIYENEMLAYLGMPPMTLPTDLMHFDSPALRDYVAEAVAVSIDRIEEMRKTCPDLVVLVEQRLDFSRWVPEGFGTGDLVIIGDGQMDVMDLKYGKGILVEAKDNSQMRLYGLGAYNMHSFLYAITKVRMQILQPRLQNYGYEVMEVEELVKWADEYVQPRALMAWNGEGEFVPGEHCTSGFCRARFQCAARGAESRELALKAFALVEPELLTTAQLVDVLGKADQAISWLTDVKAYALKQAERGEKLPGFKLVEGRSNRKYVDQDSVAQKLIESGVAEALIYERSLLGITAMEKLLGKKKFGELLGDSVTKPVGKPVLVPEADKREPLAVTSVLSVFSEDRG